MTEIQIADSPTTESVYRAHKDRIFSERSAIEDSQHSTTGKYIDQMKEYALTKIPNTEAMTMNCATFVDFTFVCNFIGVQDNINRDRVYPALRLLGYNKCYHEYKLSGSDVFSDIHELTSKCITSFDIDAMRFASRGHTIFTGTSVKSARVDRQIAAIATKRSKECSIKTADLNLYHALCGLRVLTDNDPNYILLKDKNIFASSLCVLDDADKSLLKQKKILRVLAE